MARHNKHIAIAHEALLSVAGGRRAGGESLVTRHKEAPLAATSPSLPLPSPGCRAVYFVQTLVFLHRRRLDINNLRITTNALSLPSISSIRVRYLCIIMYFRLTF